MTTQIWLAIIAIVAAPLTALLTSILLRRKYDTELEKLRADVTKAQADARGKELDNVRTGNDILMQQIVEPLRSEIKSLRSDVNKFRKAIEKIPGCSYSDDCPVSRELFNDEKSDGGKSANGK